MLMQTLDPTQPGALDQFAQAIFKMLTAFGLKAAFCQTAYYCLVPALLGRGRTIGKLLLRLRVADAAVPGGVAISSGPAGICGPNPLRESAGPAGAGERSAGFVFFGRTHAARPFVPYNCGAE